MNVSVERVVNDATLKITLPAEEVNKGFKKAISKIANSVNIPGFRKGKAPRNIIEMHYGKDAIKQEAFEIVANDCYTKALDQESLIPVSDPKVEESVFEENKDMELTIKVTLKPEIELGEYKGLSVEKKEAVVEDADVDAAVEELRSRQAKMVIAEEGTIIEKGDFAIIDFAGTVDGEAFSGGEGKEAVFKVNVQDVKRKELPELNDEYVAANSEYKTVAELKASYKERMQQNAENNAKVEYEKALIDAAVANAKFEVPEIMVEDRISQMVDEMRMSLESRKMTLEMYMQYTGMDMAKIRENQRATAAENVKTDLVLDAIAKAENIQVSMEDVDAELSAIAAQHGATLDEVKNIIKSNGNMGLLLANILRRKAAHVVIDNAK